MALGALQQLAVHADVVPTGIGLGSQHRDHFAVNLHAALLDHRLGAAAAGHTGCRKNLLQPLQLGRGAWLGIGLRLGRVFRLRVFFRLRAVFGCDFRFCYGVGIDRSFGLAIGGISDWVFNPGCFGFRFDRSFGFGCGF